MTLLERASYIRRTHFHDNQTMEFDGEGFELINAWLGNKITTSQANDAANLSSEEMYKYFALTLRDGVSKGLLQVALKGDGDSISIACSNFAAGLLKVLLKGDGDSNQSNRFNLGENVYWETHSQAEIAVHTGVIKAIVLPNRKPTKIDGYRLKIRGKGRKRTSYLVAVKNRLYWPVVGTLTKVK